MKKSIANWGNYPVIEAEVKPFTLVRELQHKLTVSNENIARGMGRCYGDAALSSTVFSTLHFNHILDFYMLQDIMKKIKEKRKEELDEMEEQDDFFMPSADLSKNEDEKFEEEITNTENFFSDNKNKNYNDPIDTDINKFLKWLTMLLYSGDHSVIITEDKNGINIKLIKINKGKK